MDQAGARIPWTAVCLACDYPLRGLKHHACPECGRVFNPADRSTYRRLPLLTYTGKLYRGELIVIVFVALLLGFITFGIIYSNLLWFLF